jgi:hypothetical protein
MEGNVRQPVKVTGRPPRLNSKRHNVILSNDVWQWLARNKNASAEIERLGREAMAGEGSDGSNVQS